MPKDCKDERPRRQPLWPKTPKDCKDERPRTVKLKTQFWSMVLSGTLEDLDSLILPILRSSPSQAFLIVVLNHCLTFFWDFFGISLSINIQAKSKIKMVNSRSVTVSVTRTFFLKNTDVGPKKHEKHQKKSQKTREKHEFFAKISKNLTHPTFFIAFLCINIFKVEKIGNFFQKNV